MALHNSILLGDSSKFKIIVDPVVVIPDMLSKNASLIEKSTVDKRKGKLPNTAIANQARVEKINVCCKFKR
tara:strand:- start:2807 stop:3019 length:213 start_codon:yes stop_codon:yes gene_type:complete